MNSQQIVETQSTNGLTRLIYAGVFLVVTSACFVRAYAGYMHHLVQTKQFHSVTTIAEYSALIDYLFFLSQLAVLLRFFRPLPNVISSRPSKNPEEPRLKSVGLGFLAGLLTFLVGASFVGGPQSSRIGTFLANHLFNASAGALILVAAVLVPVASEV